MDDRARRDRRHQGGLAGGRRTPAAIPPRPPHLRPTDVRRADQGSRRGARRVLEGERVKADASVYEEKRVIRRALAYRSGKAGGSSLRSARPDAWSSRRSTATSPSGSSGGHPWARISTASSP